ncbi:MAG: T9SS type A sorting domain-containing protein [Spirochaetales bacterium]|nr:T9SS type A sorting domain-containing protein [Spirochaetales bacterium]
MSGSQTQTGGTLSADFLILSGGDLTVSSPADLSVGTDFTINNASSIYDGTGSVSIGLGNLAVSAGEYSGNGALTLTGAATGDILISGTGLFNTLSGGDATLTAGDFLYSSTGTSAAAGDIILTVGDLILSSGIVSLTGAVTLNGADGDLTVSGGTLSANSQVTLDGDNGDLTISGGTLNGTGDINVDGNVLISSGTLDGTGRTINAAGDWDQSGGIFTAGSDLVIFDGTTPSLTMSDDFYDVTISGGVTLFSDIVLGGEMIISGTLDVGADFQVDVADSWSNSGTFISQNGLVFLGGNSAGPHTLATGGSSFYDLEITSDDYSSTAGVDVQNQLVISSGSHTQTAGSLSTDALVLSGGDLTVSAPASLAIATDFNISNSASLYDGTGVVSINSGNLAVSAGEYSGNGALTLTGAATGDIQITGTGLFNSLANADTTLTVGNLIYSSTGTSAIAGEITLTAGDMTLSNGSVSFTGTLDFDGADGDLTVNSGIITADNTIVFNGSDGDMAVNGGTVAVNSTITFNGTDGDLTVSGGTFSANDLVTLSGTGGNLTISGGTFDGTGDLDINGFVLINGGTLDGSARAINAAGDWDETSGAFICGTSLVTFDGTAPGLASISPFYNFILDGLSVTLDSNLDVNGNFTISNGTFSGADHNIDVAGNWINNDTFDYGTSGNVSVSGVGALSITTGGDPFFDLTVSGSTYGMTDDLIIDNSLTTSGIYEPGNHYITFNGTLWTTTGSFDHTVGGGANSTVHFTDGTVIVVSGSNRFYNFLYQENGGMIEFEEGQTQTVSNDFTVEGDSNTEATMITLTSINPVPSPVGDGDEDRWILTLEGSANISGVIIINSRATFPITPAPDCFDGPGNGGGNNENWLFVIPVIVSWTEDSDGNGRIDRIRVRVDNRGNLTDDILDNGGVMDFSGVAAAVDGYTVTGFSRDDRSFTGDPADPYIEYEFLILLREQEHTDTDITPQWKLTENTTLIGFVGTAPVEYGPDVNKQTPLDNAAPVFNYTLASAEKNRIFVQFSESVRHSGGGIVDENDFSFLGGATVTGLNRITTEGEGTSELELILDSPVAVDEILTGVTIQTGTDFDDIITSAPVSSFPRADSDPLPAPYDDPLFPAGNSHRVSDLALGLTGDGILQPVYATDDSQTDSARGGIGTIRDFTGGAWLQDQPIELTSHINSGHSAPSGTVPQVELYFDVDVPTAYRQNNSEEGLWLPGVSFGDTPGANDYDVYDFYGIVPSPNPDERAAAVEASPSNQLRIHSFDNDDPELESVADVEFIYFLPDYNLFAARIENSSSGEWYRQVKPWTFAIHDITAQAGGVTILKNVINPENGETTNLHYELTEAGMVTIQVFDISGAMVDILQRGRQEAGEHSTAWDGHNSGGRIVARGVYFIRVVAPGIDETRKVMVVK